MIVILAERIEPWLKYIWEQFARVNKLEADFIFLSYDQYAQTNLRDTCLLVIEYSSYQKFSQSLFIPKIKKFKTDDYKWIRDEFPVYAASFDEKFKEFDIFYNAFVHLSRLEEWISEKKGKRIHSYAFRHPRKDKRIWKVPVVNLLFNRLEAKIKEKCPEIPFGGKEKPKIQFSHDVDYIRKTIQLRIKQSSFYFLKSASFFFQHEAKKSWETFIKCIDSGIGNTGYWFFDFWSELEHRFNIASVYYIYSRAGSSQRWNALRWFLDPSYDIKKDKELILKCRELISRGHKVGLHGSFFSAGDVSLFLQEKCVLEKAVNHSINETRQHWFNYLESTTPYIHERAGIKIDSSLGYNDIEGFRSGIASIYNPYNHRSQKAFSFDELPPVVMDAHVENHADCADLSDWLFGCLDQVKKSAVSVDWHQRGASLEYGWAASYAKLCKDYKSIVLI